MTDGHAMWLTYGWTVHFHGMTDRHVMWLTYGWTSCVDGMTDGCDTFFTKTPIAP